MNKENLYQTPESNLGSGVSGDVIYAGFWIRVLASLIDTVLLLLVIVPLLTAIYGKGYWFSEPKGNILWDILLNYILPAIIIIVFWLYKSATPGKIVLGLKVISLGSKSELSAGQSIGRYFSYYLSLIPLFAGFISIAFDERKQGWHDKLANTAVVKIEKKG